MAPLFFDFILAFSNMLSLGSSKPWPDAMEILTGTRKMDASGVLGYFKPLHDWLKAENEKNGEFVGWEPSTVRKCPISSPFILACYFRTLLLDWTINVGWSSSYSNHH